MQIIIDRYLWSENRWNLLSKKCESWNNMVISVICNCKAVKISKCWHFITALITTNSGITNVIMFRRWCLQQDYYCYSKCYCVTEWATISVIQLCNIITLHASPAMAVTWPKYVKVLVKCTFETFANEGMRCNKYLILLFANRKQDSPSWKLKQVP